MMFSKLRKYLKKKDEKELESNPINDIFYDLSIDRKERSPSSESEEAELPDDIQELEDTKRARYEKIKKKYAR